MTRPDLVWYAAYGSNLSRERFMRYLDGGRPEGSTFAETGAPDASPPRDFQVAVLRHRLVFAGWSPRWKGATAHLMVGHDPSAHTLARLYLVSRDQLESVCTQEGTAYELVECHEPVDGYEVFAVTVADPGPPGAPSPAYVDTMARGLAESWHLDEEAARRSVNQATGHATSTPRHR